MKTKTTAFFSLFVVMLLGQAPDALSQVQRASPMANRSGFDPALGYASMDAINSIYDPSAMDGGVSRTSFCGGCGAPEPDQCSCDGPGCDGSCGGICGGGCGGGGILGGGGLLGGGLLSGHRGAGGIGGALAGLTGPGGAWMDLEYLLFWSKQRYLPTLVTTAPDGTPFFQAGAFGQPGTESLFVNDLIGGGPHSGFRISTGTWLDPEQTLGLGGRFFIVGGEEDFSANSDQHPILAIPAFDVDAGLQNSYVVAYPGESNGNVNLKASNHAIGFDVFVRKLMLSGNCNRLDFIGGFHHSTVQDEVELSSTSISQNNAGRVPIGGTIDRKDSFEVTNSFNGGFVGLMGQAEDGPLSWRLLAKVAMGNMNQEASVRGSTVASIAGNSATSDFGFLALPSNIGKFDRDEFAVVPELNVGVAYNLSSSAQIMLGYNLIYWSKVALAGDLIDQTVNQTQVTGGGLVGEARPIATLVDDGYWYSGLSIGASLRF